MNPMSRIDFVIKALMVLNRKSIALFMCRVVPSIVSLGLAVLIIFGANFFIGENPINGLLGANIIFPTYVTVQFYIAGGYKRVYKKLMDEFKEFNKKVSDELMALAAEAFVKSDLGRGHNEMDI